MGMFFLIRGQPADAPSAVAAQRLAERMGFARPTIVTVEDVTLFLYPKLGQSAANFLSFANGDFVAGCGTFVFAGATGGTALRAFYDEFDGDFSLLDNATCNFAVILRKNGCIYVTGDRFGGYHIFRDSLLTVVSSSFLIACELLDRLTIIPQNVYEYVFNGVVSGNESLAAELSLLPIASAVVFSPDDVRLDQSGTLPPDRTSALDRETLIEQALALLNSQFEQITRAFGDRINCALSGGFDSRLILAFLRQCGVTPRIYVYGRPEDEDVVIASEIARGERFTIESVDKDEGQPVGPTDFPNVVAGNYLAADGYSWPGLFHNGAERTQSAVRVAGGAIALNGGGGEILRNFFYLPDGRFRLRNLVWSFYAQFDPHSCSPRFSTERYFRELERKIAELVGPIDYLERPTIEWLYHRFRCRSWDGRVDTINSRFGFTGLPFLHPRITEFGASVPIRWKYHGAFEAELIRRADPRLATYRSNYGFSFAEPPPAYARIKNYATYLRPPSARRLTHRMKNRWNPRPETHYTQPHYVASVLPGGIEIMRDFFRLERIGDAAHMGRILSLEYLFRQLGGKVNWNG